MKSKLIFFLLLVLVFSGCNQLSKKSSKESINVENNTASVVDNTFRNERQKHIQNPWFIASECIFNYFNTGMRWELTDMQKLNASIIVATKLPDLIGDMEGNVMNLEIAEQFCKEYSVENADLGSSENFKDIWISTTNGRNMWNLMFSAYNNVK